MKIIMTAWILIGMTPYVLAQVPVPAPPQGGPIAIMNGVVHSGNGDVIENGIITIENGKITSVGDARSVRIDLSGYEVINVSGKHVYPGLILSNTNLGLVDINAVRATLDYNEVGEFTPNIRSLIAYNTDSEVIPTLRFNGILLAQVVPQGGTISGSSSVVMLDGWNWEDAAYVADNGIHLHWPGYMKQPAWISGSGEWKENTDYKESVQRIEKFLQDAKAYWAKNKPEEINLKLESMKGIFDGRMTMFIHVDGKREIIESVKMLRRYGVPKVVVVGASDAYHVMDFLKEQEIPVILSKVHRLPERNEEDVDMPYKLPLLLKEKGILVALAHSGEVQSARNLAFYAGTASGYGLDKEEALKMITSNPARILGIDHLTGSLEPGKDANIIISEGDLLDMRSSKLMYAFIRGKKLDLYGRQQMLYDRYREKYSGEHQR